MFKVEPGWRFTMRQSKYVLLTVLLVAVIGVASYWFAGKKEIYSSNIEDVRSISYTYMDYMGRVSSSSIVAIGEMDEIRNTIKDIDESHPKRVIRAEDKTGAIIITFSMLDENNNEIKSYSIKGEYLAVGEMDNKFVSVYSVASEKMDHLRNVFRKAVEK